jgi:hypothetical protein
VAIKKGSFIENTSGIQIQGYPLMIEDRRVSLRGFKLRPHPTLSHGEREKTWREGLAKKIKFDWRHYYW